MTRALYWFWTGVSVVAILGALYFAAMRRLMEW
jgi:hypothetical protein